MQTGHQIMGQSYYILHMWVQLTFIRSLDLFINRCLFFCLFAYLATDGYVLKCVAPVTARFLTAYQRTTPQSTLRPTRDTGALMTTSRRST